MAVGIEARSLLIRYFPFTPGNCIILLIVGFIFLKDLSQPADIQQPTVTATQIIHQKYSLTNQFPNSKRISKIPISWIKYTDGSLVENLH